MGKLSRDKVQIEHKSFPAVVVAIDEALGIVEAVVSVIGNLDDGDDIIHTGAFTKTIAERGNRIRVLDQHRTDSTLRVVGKCLELREIGRQALPPEIVAQYPDATGGLLTKTQYLLDTPEGAGVFKRIQAGALGEYSIGFDIVQQDFARKEIEGRGVVNVRNIRELRLWEYSPVIWGMNPATATVDVKAADDATSADAVAGAKEWAPEGTTKLIGEHLLGWLAYVLVDQLTDFLIRGQISIDEFLQVQTVGTEAITGLRGSIPEDILTRPVMPQPVFDDWLWMGRGLPEDRKAAIRQAMKAVAADAAADAAAETQTEGTLVGSEDTGAAPAVDSSPTSSGAVDALEVERMRQEIEIELSMSEG